MTSGPGGAGGAGATGGETAQGGGCQDADEEDFSATPAASPSDDDFMSEDDTLSRWGARFFVINEAFYMGSTHCSATLCEGVLRLRPGTPSSNAGYFWHSTLGGTQGQSGPIIYQNISGDFAFEVDVELAANGSTTDDYTGAGLVARDPAATNHYVQYAFGRHGSSELGTVGRLRNPDDMYGGATLVVGDPTPTTATRGRLLLCRVGGDFSFHRRLEGEAIATTDETTMHPSYDIGFDNVAALEVGLSVHWFQGMEASYDALFRDARFHLSPASHQACRALLDD